jgi:hypothetical protein
MDSGVKILPDGIRTGAPPLINKKIITVTTIEATGTGVGVTTMVWKANSGSYVLTLSGGSARFYDDLAATTGECTNKIITPTSGNIYVKCSGSSSTMIISDSANVSYLSWGTQASGLNCPILKININNLNNVEYLRFGPTSYGGCYVTGSITNKPIYDLLIYCDTYSLITGNLDPKYIQRLYLLRGFNIGGDLTNASKLNYIYAPDGSGFRTLSITGDIGTWPKTGWTTFLLQQSNEMYGTLDWTGCTFTSIILGGNNTVTVDFTKIPNTVFQFTVTGNNRTVDYATRTWPATMQIFVLSPGVGYGLSSAEVDQILIDLANYDWGGAKLITLTGSNAARTDASNAAVTHLTVTHGCTVTTNP